MKVGIVTYHRSHNYGALLQAVALRHVLIEMGHCVYYVDYYPKYEDKVYTLFDLYEFKAKTTLHKKCGFIWRAIKKWPYQLPRYINFLRFRYKYIEPFSRSTTEAYDVIVYGSDQIWRKQPFTNEYDPVFFGDNYYSTSLSISYAASFDKLPDCTLDISKFKRLITNFGKLSVREQSMVDFLTLQGLTDVVKSVDPAFLLPAEKWNEIIQDKRVIKEKYVLVYDLQRNMNIKIVDSKYIENEAKKYNLKVVRLKNEATTISSKYCRDSADPSDFLNLIRHAECVVSTSYHGAVFSIIYRKTFFVSQRINVVRIFNLLNDLGLSDRIISPDEGVDDILTPVDYNEVDIKLNCLINNSLDYLSTL